MIGQIKTWRRDHTWPTGRITDELAELGFSTEPRPAHLRIGFAATADHSELTEGARRLGAALTDLTEGGVRRDHFRVPDYV
ncbi:hypothetical protein [Streptomyces sp. NPDC060035]|uniref:hypothetical protein n=1 Tax=Streptomyces sp. NPDC060035 TaxID=3347044 RepID=UPI0036CC561D